MLLRIFVIAVLASAVFGACWLAIHELYVKPEQRLHADKALPPPTPPPDPSLADFEKCVEIHRAGNRAASRRAIEQFLREFPTSTKRDGINDMLGEINAAEFFATKPNEENTYIVRSGDALPRVAARTKISVELLTYLNRIEGKYLHPNQRLLAPHVAFRLVVQQKKQRVVIYNGDKFFRQYPAAEWPGGGKAPIRPKQEGRVTEKRAFDSAGTVPPAKLAYFDAYHMMLISIPGCSLHTQPADPKAIVQRPPGGGIGLAPEHMNEIAILLPSGAPVIME
ncbi:MAG: LysM peptidoglycan-binding domain-containing protein [Chthoniobacteraceae bacterium]